MSFGYPAASRSDVVDDVFGERVADPYRWLEDAGDPMTVAWCAAQDALAADHLDALDARPVLAALIEEAMHVGTVSPPVCRGDRAFFTRLRPGAERPVLCVADRANVECVSAERVLFEPAPDVTLGRWFPSPSGTRVACCVSTGGTEESSIIVLDTESGNEVAESIPDCRFASVAWAPGDEVFYHSRHNRVWARRDGTDTQVHGPPDDPGVNHTLDISEDGRWLAVSSRAGAAPRNQVLLVDLSTNSSRLVHKGAMAHAWLQNGLLYLLTDLDAPRRRLCAVALDSLACTEIVPEDPVGVLEHAAVLDDGSVLVAHAVDGVSRLTWADAVVELPGNGTVTGLSRITGREIAIGYTDFTTPPTVLRWSSDAPTVTKPWLDDGNPATGIELTRREYQSADGTSVGVFVLSAAGSPVGPRPTVLTGYGGFGVSLRPTYAPDRLAWVRWGGVYVVACLRGGGERGREWHAAGRREHKPKTFEDFEAVADGLCADGWTTPDMLGIEGSSNGGLLVGAAITRSPDRYRAAVCAAPLLDMLRYERFGLGPYWVDEYGSVQDREQAGWLLSYSPYHHVVPGTAYPAVLLVTFEADTRVDPLHARKMCAALQHAAHRNPGGITVLRREQAAGHGEAAATRAIQSAADRLAFLATYCNPYPPVNRGNGGSFPDGG